ncbi:MAG TPA: TetR family transcriptional regulator [Novosphingobium sp.]|nr:TetR family transcriptional regulator [Novosphingobium sp.]
MIGSPAELDPARERAVDAALEILELRGPNALTLGEVANRLNLSVSALQRSFETYDDLLEALAERWFRGKVAIMEEVVASDLPPRRKMYEFFARRFVLMRDSYRADPALFEMHAELGNQHFEIVRSYVDLGDHYLCEIIAEAIADGHFPGLSIDEALSLINQMVAAYVNIALMTMVMDKLSETKLARIVDTIFDGLSAEDRGALPVTGLRAA